MAKKRATAKKAATKKTTRTKSAPKRTVKKAVRKKSSGASTKKATAKKNSDIKPTTPARKKTATPEAQIRQMDREILSLINKRAALTTRMINSSENPQASIFDAAHDQELWDKLMQANNGPLPHATVRSIFRDVLSAARRQVKIQRVAYLGPPYSFTHIAAIDRFGKWADLVPVSTIASVFEEVNRGHAEYGIVPIENSTDGRVVDTLDMFTRLPLQICGEVQISIHHNLLSKCPRSEITEIYSKPQALSQCRDWLARNMPQARLIEVTSTSTAARLAQDKPGAAAIASLQAAVEYDLLVIADDIEDNADNVTRFAIIGDEVSKPTGHDRTAVLLQISHSPGALSDALVGFKKNKVNLTWIESFPLRGPESGYLFFLDFEGHVEDRKVKKTLEELEKQAIVLKILGSYPRCEPRE